MDNFQDEGIFGYDLSWYQDKNDTVQGIDFEMMKAYGTSFVIIRAGQDTWQDEDFEYNWSHAKEAGIPRSAYWFGDKDSSGKSQAQRFWSLVKNDQPEGILFVDYEDGSWTDWNQLYAFIVELQRLSGFPDSRIGIYTAYYYWVDHSPSNASSKAWFGKYILWLAAYTAHPELVKIPLPWTACLIWQDEIILSGGTGVESKEVDHNRFNGDAEKFELYMGGTPVIVPPEGEDMILYYADLKPGLESNVRPAADLQATPATIITGPLTISIVSEKTEADGYNWYRIVEPINGYIALTSSYTNFRPATSTSPDTMEITLKLQDGTLYKGMVTKQ